MKKLFYISTLLLLFTMHLCHGQLTIYNHCNKYLNFAISYHPYNSTYWENAGWWAVAPGTSKVVLNSIGNRYVYIYAETEDEGYVWDGDYTICVNRYKEFNYKVYGDADYCPTDFVPLSFKKIDTGGSKKHDLDFKCEGAAHNYNPIENWGSSSGGGHDDFFNPAPTNASASDFVYIEYRAESCLECSYTHVSYLHNTHNSRAITVKYEKVDWSGNHISTDSVKIEARDVEQLGSNGNIGGDVKSPYKYRILSAAFAD